MITPNVVADEIARVLHRVLDHYMPNDKLEAAIDHARYVVERHTRTAHDIWWEGYYTGYRTAQYSIVPEPRAPAALHPLAGGQVPQSTDGDEASTEKDSRS